MNQTYRNLLKWSLYGLLFLLVLMVQTVVLGDWRVLGTKLSLLPVWVACVACREDHETGSLYALCCGLALQLSGAAAGSVSILMLPLAAAVGGYVCSTYLTRSLLPVLAACALALCLCEGGVYFQRLYLDAALPPDAGLLLLKQIALSLPAALLLWPLTRAIHKTGGAYGA